MPTNPSSVPTAAERFPTSDLDWPDEAWLISCGIGQPLGGGVDTIGTETAQARQTQINKAGFFAVVSLAVLASHSAVLFIPPLLVEIATDLDISVAFAGQLATATFAAWGVSVISVGPLSDSFGRRPVCLAGLFVLSASVLGSAFAPNIEALLGLRVLTGLAGGMLPPNAVGAVSDIISPERRAQAIGALLAISVLTSAVTVPMVALLTDWGGWRFALFVSGVFLASVFLANWLWFPRGSKLRASTWVFFSRYWSLLSLRFFRVAIGVNMTQRIAYWGTLSYFAAYLIHTYGVSVGFVALPLAISAVGQMIGSYSGGFVAKNRRRALVVGATSAAGGVCGLLLFSGGFHLWVAVAVATLGTGLLSVTHPVLVAACTEYSGDSKATGVGLMGLSNQIGGVLGAALAGALLAGTGYEGIGYLCLGVTIASALLTSLFGRQFGENAG